MTTDLLTPSAMGWESASLAATWMVCVGGGLKATLPAMARGASHDMPMQTAAMRTAAPAARADVLVVFIRFLRALNAGYRSVLTPKRTVLMGLFFSLLAASLSSPTGWLVSRMLRSVSEIVPS